MSTIIIDKVMHVIQNRSVTMTQRLLRRVYSGSLDTVTYCGSLISLSYFLHRVISLFYSEPELGLSVSWCVNPETIAEAN